MRLLPEQLQVEAERIQNFLQEKPGSEPNDLIDRVEELNITIAETGKMLADAEWYRDELIEGAVMKALKDHMEEKLSASTINQYVKSLVRDKNFLVKWIDRLNATATHQADNLRTIISYRKAEMNL